MLGSYLGVFIALFLIFELAFLYDYPTQNSFIINLGTELSYFLIWLIIFSIIGFLIGWGIHSLIKYWRKNRTVKSSQ